MMRCPTCSKQSRPLCPYYGECKYRKSGLCPVAVCWQKPDLCTAYHNQEGMVKSILTPSSRRFGEEV